MIKLKNKYQNLFYQDFKDAEKNGIDAIKYTYKKLFKEYKDNYVCLTELALILYERRDKHKVNNTRTSKLYNKLYEDINDYAMQTLKHEKLDYYFKRVC